MTSTDPKPADAAPGKTLAERTGIYIASKTRHAEQWRTLRAEGWPIISTWIDEAGPGETADFADLWRRCIHEATHAERLILVATYGEVLKGAFIEVGAALAAGVPVYYVGESLLSNSFLHHPLVTTCATLDEARTAAKPAAALVAEEDAARPGIAVEGEGEEVFRVRSELHGAAMNVRCDADKQCDALEAAGFNHMEMYKLGHRDARHAIAEMLLTHPAIAALLSERDALAERGRLAEEVAEACLENGRAMDAFEASSYLDSSRPTAAYERFQIAISAYRAARAVPGEGKPQ
jgi:hypothetical protein